MVGVDEGAVLPNGVFMTPIQVAWATSRGQSAAVNAAAREVMGYGVEVVAFLEDDDRWHPSKMEMQLARLELAPFQSCSQQIVSEDQQKVFGVNDYPIPSSWVMWSDVWKRIGKGASEASGGGGRLGGPAAPEGGGFDESVRYLVDSEWLGRLNQAKVPRIHLVENRTKLQDWHFGFSSYTSRHATIVPSGMAEPLVTRTQNTAGGMCTISRDSKAAAIADSEQAMLLAKYGEHPW